MLAGNHSAPLLTVPVKLFPNLFEYLLPNRIGQGYRAAAFQPGSHDVSVDVSVTGVAKGRQPDSEALGDFLDFPNMPGHLGEGQRNVQDFHGLLLDGLVYLAPDVEDQSLPGRSVGHLDVQTPAAQAGLGRFLRQAIHLLLRGSVQDDQEVRLSQVGGPFLLQIGFGRPDDVAADEFHGQGQGPAAKDERHGL